MICRYVKGIVGGFEIGDLRMEETPADDLARPAPPPRRGAGGGFTDRFAHSARPVLADLGCASA